MRKPIFIPDKYRKKLRIEAAANDVSMYKQATRIFMHYYDPDHEVPTIQEGEATPLPKKKERRDRKESDEFISHFTAEYLKRISKQMPFVNRAIVYRNLSDPLKHYGLERLKTLLSAFFASDDKWYQEQKWGILTFLSMRTLNKLE